MCRTIQPRKNYKRIIQAFELFNNSYKDYNLVILGRKGWKYKDILTNNSKIKYYDYVPKKIY
jgi:glycosyltransferase involved in cell wall biosynthesis